MPIGLTQKQLDHFALQKFEPVKYEPHGSDPIDYGKINFMGTGLSIKENAIPNSVNDNPNEPDYDENLKSILHNAGLFKPSDIRLYDKFYRFSPLDPYNFLGPTREYVFFVKPDLHIFNSYDTRLDMIPTLQEQLRKNGIFSDLVKRGYAKDLSQLQTSGISGSSPFMNLLSNRKVGSVDLTPMQADSFETSRNYYGTAMYYRKGSENSDENIDFSVEFEDTKNLEVYMLFRAYDEYERLKWYGRISPPRQEYIWYKILHDQFGLFKFIVDEDGEHIIHWSQFWGVYPTNVPRDVFSELPQDGHLRFTINFKAAFVEDMNINTLYDFDYLCKNHYQTGFQMPIWDKKNHNVSGEFADFPRIVDNSEEEKRRYMGGNQFYRRYKLVWNTRTAQS